MADSVSCFRSEKCHLVRSTFPDAPISCSLSPCVSQTEIIMFTPSFPLRVLLIPTLTKALRALGTFPQEFNGALMESLR